MLRRRRWTRRDWAFVECVAVLFGLGLVLELLDLSAAKSGGIGWLWILPAIASLVGIMWLVAREPANL